MYVCVSNPVYGILFCHHELRKALPKSNSILQGLALDLLNERELQKLSYLTPSPQSLIFKTCCKL
jgi:hypothetical protein